MKNFAIPTLLIAAGLSGCASDGLRASGTFQTHASYDRLFTAAMASPTAVGYHTTSVNRADGLITAEQGVLMGHGNAVGMTAVVTRDGGVRTLHVSFVAPPGTFSMGDFHQNLDDYVAAVRAAVPDLHAGI